MRYPVSDLEFSSHASACAKREILLKSGRRCNTVLAVAWLLACCLSAALPPIIRACVRACVRVCMCACVRVHVCIMCVGGSMKLPSMKLPLAVRPQPLNRPKGGSMKLPALSNTASAPVAGGGTERPPSALASADLALALALALALSVALSVALALSIALSTEELGPLPRGPSRVLVLLVC